MVSVTGLDGEITQYAYDAAGRRIRTQSDSLTTVYEYDIVGSLIRQETSGASEIAFQYSHNKNGYHKTEACNHRLTWLLIPIGATQQDM